MRPTLWLKNDAGEVWNLRPSNLLRARDASFFATLDGTGFETKLTFARVKNDFVITEEAPQQITIKGTMYFRDPKHMAAFGDFVGDYSNTLRLYYDPEGRISPTAQLERPWYKEVRITKLTSGEQDVKTGYWVCPMEFAPFSVMWRRDTTRASTVTSVEGDAHVYAYTYPYFYQSERKFYLDMENTGAQIGCVIAIKNTGTHALEKLEWVATSGDHKQYARWLEGVGLAPGRTLIVDSNPSTQRAVVQTGSDTVDDVSDYQEANPQYINFIELYHGQNQIVFNLGTVSDVEIEVTFIEQVRVL